MLNFNRIWAVNLNLFIFSLSPYSLVYILVSGSQERESKDFERTFFQLLVIKYGRKQKVRFYA